MQIMPRNIPGWTVYANSVFFIVECGENESFSVREIIPDILNQMWCVEEQEGFFIVIFRMLNKKLVFFVLRTLIAVTFKSRRLVLVDFLKLRFR